MQFDRSLGEKAPCPQLPALEGTLQLGPPPPTPAPKWQRSSTFLTPPSLLQILLRYWQRGKDKAGTRGSEPLLRAGTSLLAMQESIEREKYRRPD